MIRCLEFISKYLRGKEKMAGSVDRTRLVMNSKWLKLSDGYMRVNDAMILYY